MTLWAINPALGTHQPEIRDTDCQDICSRMLTEALFVAKERERGKVRDEKHTMEFSSVIDQ